MPYTITTIKLPSSASCVRMAGNGVISKEDAEHALTIVGRRGSMFGAPILLLTQQMKSLSKEARALYATNFDSGDDMPWCGVVVTNPLIRVAANFISRASGYNKLKMFSTEAETVRWLDERARADAAKAT
ncbi:MAG TPA: hypothetical protein VIG99_07140 [Myxococcaceae bacterium]|jgi:hypothetical protein